MALKDFYRGDTRVYRIEVVDGNGQPIDITGATIWFTAKMNIKKSDADASIQKKITSHAIPESGISELTLDPINTKNLTVGSYHYDFQLVDASGNVFTFEKGRFKLMQDITLDTEIVEDGGLPVGYGSVFIERTVNNVITHVAVSGLLDVYSKSVAGDLVIVHPGYFDLIDESIQLKTLVNWEFKPGVEIISTTNEFTDNGVDVEVIWFGTPKLTTGYVLTGASSVITQIPFYDGTTLAVDSLVIGGTKLENHIGYVSDVSIRGNVSIEGTAFNRFRNYDGAYGVGIGNYRSRGSFDNPTAILDGDRVSTYIWGAYDGTKYIETGVMEIIVNGAVSTGAIPMDLAFNTGSNGYGIERLRIKSDGSIIIADLPITDPISAGQLWNDLGTVKISAG